jgi:hypothetical protein
MLRKLAIPRGVREHAPIQQLKEIPIARTAFCLEIPKDPALSFGLVHVELYFNVAADLVLPIL